MIEQIIPYKPTHPVEVLHDELKASMNMITPELKNNRNHTNHINQKNHSSDIFPVDFTHKTYRNLLQTLLDQGFSFQPFEDYLTAPARFKKQDGRNDRTWPVTN